MGAALMVLKIIGIIILLALALIVLALILVLAVPIKYSAQAEKYESIRARINAAWLFKLLNITAEFENKALSYKVKVFGRVLASSEKEEKEEETEEKADAEPPKAKELVFEETQPEAKAEPIKTEEIYEEKESQTDEDEKKRLEFEEYKKSCTKAVARRVKIKETEETPESREEKPKEEEKESKGKTLDKDYFIKMPLSEKKALLGCAVRLIKRVLKGVLPRNFYMDAKVGTGDPASTGYILAAAGVIKGTVFKDVSIKGDFEKAGFEGEGKLTGKITIGYLVYSALCFALAKPVRKIIILFLKGRGVKK